MHVHGFGVICAMSRAPCLWATERTAQREIVLLRRLTAPVKMLTLLHGCDRFNFGIADLIAFAVIIDRWLSVRPSSVPVLVRYTQLRMSL